MRWQNEQTKTTHLKSANMEMKWERRNRTRVGEIWREQAGLWRERNSLIWPHPPCNGQSFHGLLREERQPEERDRTVDTSNQRQTDDMTLSFSLSPITALWQNVSLYFNSVHPSCSSKLRVSLWTGNRTSYQSTGGLCGLCKSKGLDIKHQK